MNTSFFNRVFWVKNSEMSEINENEPSSASTPKKSTYDRDEAGVPTILKDGQVAKRTFGKHPIVLFVILNILIFFILGIAGAVAFKNGCLPSRGIG
jgi:hypothetical protein